MSAYLTATEAAAHLHFPTVGAFRSFLWRRRQAGFPVTTYRRGGRLLFKAPDLDAALTVERARQPRIVKAS